MRTTVPEVRPQTQLLTYSEAAEQLRIDPRTVRSYADAGRLVRVALSTQTVRVTAESVEALIAQSLLAG
jgi:excisionase family DNA binding protein